MATTQEIKDIVAKIRVTKNDNVFATDLDAVILKIKKEKSINIEFKTGDADQWINNGDVFIISGFAKKESNTQFIIEINPFDSLKRIKFTKAHEIGHILLEHFNDEVDKIIDSKDNEFINNSDDLKLRSVEFNKNDPEEKDANSFAAELLMPEALVRQEFPSSYISYVDIKIGSEKFEVSEAAMITRLKWLGYKLAF